MQWSTQRRWLRGRAAPQAMLPAAIAQRAGGRSARTMRALNADAFDDPLERALHERKAAEGMWAIQKIHLRSGQFYYRFVNADTTPAPRWGEGAWWVDYENFRRIVTARRTRRTIARLRGAPAAGAALQLPARAGERRQRDRAGVARTAARRAGRARTHDRGSGGACDRDAMASAGPGDAVICAEARPDGRHARGGPGGVSDHRVPPHRKRLLRMKAQRSPLERDHE